MTHLTADELIDAMEDLLTPDRREHLASCPACQRQLDGLADALNEARQSSVPEPSPLFWPHFSTRVNDAIDHDLAQAWPKWLRWQVLLPVGAMAMIVLGLMITVPKQDRGEQFAFDDAVATEPSTDDNWGTFVELVGDLDLETASAAGVIELGMADAAVAHLSTEEQQELSRLLQAELTRVKS